MTVTASDGKTIFIAVRYDTQNELNSGNKFLFDYNLAIPINLNQKVTLGQQNQLI